MGEDTVICLRAYLAPCTLGNLLVSPNATTAHQTDSAQVGITLTVGPLVRQLCSQILTNTFKCRLRMSGAVIYEYSRNATRSTLSHPDSLAAVPVMVIYVNPIPVS